MGNAIELEGAVDISVAAELRRRLVEALGSGNELRVSLARVTEMDVTAVQLLWAATREAQAAGIEFAFEGQMQEPVLAMLAESGIEKFPVPA